MLEGAKDLEQIVVLLWDFLGEYLVCCPKSLLELNFHLKLCSSTILSKSFTRAWVPIVIDIN
jgi:hypothetical protein